MKIKKYNIRPEWFGAYGLDKEKNFMQAPTCECGCGGKGVLLINDRKELFGFMYNVLMENECNHCAIFSHSFDDTMFAALKVYNETCEPILFFSQEENMTFFKEWDDELELHCYGLMVEIQPGKWKIIEN